MTQPIDPAIAKVQMMLGAEKGSVLIRETLREMGIDGLRTPDDRLRFAIVLMGKGGLARAIGSAIKIQALLQGATEREEGNDPLRHTRQVLGLLVDMALAEPGQTLALSGSNDRLDRIISEIESLRLQVQTAGDEAFRSKQLFVESLAETIQELAHEGWREKVRELEEAKELLQTLNQELQRSNSELEQFAYVASHDLQEPLRMVGSYMQLLQQRYQDRLDGDAREFIGFAIDGAHRMSSMVSDLLAFSRVGTQGRDLEPIDAGECLEAALQNLQMTAHECGAKISNDPLPTVEGDASQLQQLFQNLIGNALKFRGEESPRIHVSARREDGDWVFGVRDNGIGFEARYADQIFAVFQRLHGIGRYPGTGIGLAICKKIVERHGGRIWVDSASGRGSTFWFLLRAAGDRLDRDSSPPSPALQAVGSR